MDVEAWNSDLMEDMLPKTIFLICCMVIGLFGNGFTLLIYCVKMKMSDERYFIPVLATVDLFAATICPILGVMESRMIVTFYNASVCKIFWAAASFLTMMSVFVFAVIAIQRYLKVCGSFGSTMNILWRRISLMICIVLSATFAAPMIIFHSSVEIKNVDKNLTGFQCARTNEEDETVINITHKLTTIFMVITIFFILCYVPKVILLVMEGLDDGFWENMSNNLRHVLTLPNVNFLWDSKHIVTLGHCMKVISLRKIVRDVSSAPNHN
ncbi:taste receptor type 2 member 109-like [Mytilus trossulus]|uniref:taste receptor type 2 member 109-like n=1 Tax=Mytilus trossulus TaxID=6551 RepID=UPI00300566B4